MLKEENRDKYNELLDMVKSGKNFTKKDLTYEILYELSINENVADVLIGNLFNMSINQVRYLRKKHGLENKFMKNMIDNTEGTINYLKENKNVSNLSNDEILYFVYKGLKYYCKSKNWNLNTFDRYLDEMKEKYSNQDLDLLELEFDVVVNNNKQRKIKNTKTRKMRGKKINNILSNTNKIKAGKIGEKIVFDYEKKKLQNLGLTDLVNQVAWVSKTDDEDITFDGLGYDIMSFNEMGEKIYIEVKCSTTNFTDDVIFNISDKEVKLMNGQIKNFDKKHCFIYYVSKINMDLLMAEIFIIDSDIFSTYELKATNYEVKEHYN